MNCNVRTAMVVAGVLLVAPSLWGHHGLARFDTTHTINIQGTVTDFQWTNPHVYMYADVKDEKGKVVNWKLEMGSPGMLSRFGGWNPKTVKQGDLVTVTGFRAKDGSAYMSPVEIVLPDGKKMSAAP